MTHTLLALILTTMLACNEERLSLSTDSPSQPLDAVSEPTPPAPPPPPAVVHKVPAPKKWPKCWLSSRLSTMTAFRISGFGATRTAMPTYTPSNGRQEFRGYSSNPTTHGDCVLNWFGQDHSQEPWVLQLQTKQPNMHASLTCTADATPDCTCITTIPPPPYGDSNFKNIRLNSGLCVRDAPNGEHELYNHKDPENTKPMSAAGRCDKALADVNTINDARLGDDNFLKQNQDSQDASAGGSTCRTDIEPFAPLKDEKDWYADEIRDWAITTCTDPTTSCRCYTTYFKSGHEEGKRGGGYEYDTCLLCTGGTCQSVTLP